MFQIGQQVMVDLGGISYGGVSFGAGVQASGTIIDIRGLEYIVQLGITFSGINVVGVDASRLQAIAS